MSTSRQQQQQQHQRHHLRVVLLASGQGSDASSYRPNRDNQWWNRRDALVRCVAAFLFGPGHVPNVAATTTGSSSSNDKDGDQRELVILFDGDLSRLHTTYQQPRGGALRSGDDDFVPTEKNILEVWKRCCQEPGVVISTKGFGSQLITSSSGPDANGGTGTTGTVSTSHSGIVLGSKSSKRDLLDFLHAHTSVEFLRLHRLNASATVILRKANKESLLKIYQEWRKVQNSNGAAPHSKSKGPSDSKRMDGSDLAPILHELLKPSNGCQETLAAILHESSDELPLAVCSSATTRRRQLCLFLGAVRDMTTGEINALQAACREANTPLCRVRLGPVAEFTSKILSVVAFHHSTGAMCSGLQALRSQQQTKSLVSSNLVVKRKRIDPVQSRTLSSCYVCLVPFESTCVNLDLTRRTQLWEVIRITVVSLWRSKVASRSGASGDVELFSNRLILVFADDIHVMLDDATVRALAEKHQAAPSESQVLELILKQLKESPVASTVLSKREQAMNSICDYIFSGVGPRSANEPILLLDCTRDNGIELAAKFYSDDSRLAKDDSTNGLVLVILFSLQDTGSNIQRKELLRTFEDHGAHIARARLHMPCPDRCAATLTLLQHFCYHNPAFIHQSVVGLRNKTARTRGASIK